MKDNTWHFYLTGRVQGIGFRPFIYRLAQSLEIKGTVSNDLDGVHIHFTSTKEKANLFTSKILNSAPALSIITTSKLTQVEFTIYEDFRIIQQESRSQSQVAITPDFALCQTCKDELIHSRRKNYPFISCTQCGPRYSIAQNLPFEREHTTMGLFAMCDTCKEEYTSQNDKRFFAQTTSCPDCQIQLQLVDSNKQIVSEDTSAILQLIPSLWEKGHTVAIKGIGGFLLTCAAKNSTAIQKLRERKQRPSKPFALMIPTIEYYPSLNKVNSINSALSDHVSPIVLCSKELINDDLKYVADELDTIGIMIPYAPIFEILLRKYNQPIIATSGNKTKLPISFINGEAMESLSSVADYILLNNRDIVMPQDDSVVKYAPTSNQKIVLRRSRGMAPNHFKGYIQNSHDTILCLGAEMKSTFCLHHEGNTYISQYIGTLDNIETQHHYSYILDHFLKLLKANPSHICTDAHPEYFTQKLASELAEKFNISTIRIQHHKAHFASILGEHDLVDTNKKILGVIWDGTGLGEDGMIWGSEFFIYKEYSMSRCAHLPYYPHFLKDKMALEPRISALAILFNESAASEIIQEKFTTEEWRIYSALLNKNIGLKTSSMGRVFDAAASILGIIDKQSYEGEAAMRLEVLARRYTDLHGFDSFNSYNLSIQNNTDCLAKHLLIQMIADMVEQKQRGLIAARFHKSLVQWIMTIAAKEVTNTLAFSGGVFQNSLLVDLIYHQCSSDFTLYFHHDLSPNDENISYGQYIYFNMSKKLQEKN